MYTHYSCNACHGKEGKGVGNLQNAYKKYTDAQIKSYIKNPANYNNSKMPPFDGIIPEGDFEPLIEYIKMLGEKASEKS